MHRRLVTVLVAASTTLTLGIAGAPAASAMGQTPVPSWMSNGKQFDTEIGNGRIYLGGQFTQLRSTPLGTPGPRILVTNLGAIDLATGEGVPGFDPAFTHSSTTAYVRSLALSPDGSTLYVAGRFDAVDGTPARNIAAINTADGTLVPTFAARVGGITQTVWSIELSPDGSILYVGGGFSRVNGQVRRNLAAVSTADGSVLDWTPEPNANVRGMDLSVDGQSLFIVGAFDAVDGVTRESIARIVVSTGALHPWAVPTFQISGPPMTGWSVDSDATRVYAAFGRGPNWFGAYSITTGLQAWRRNTSGNPQTVLLSADGTRLFVGGHFGTGRLNQTFSECGSTLFRGLALVSNLTTGTLDCSWIPQLEPFGNNFQGVWDLELTQAHLWFAGNFSEVNDVAQANVARAALV